MTTVDLPPEDDAAPVLVAREVHPRAIRWMHWVNFPLLFIMIWSGLRIYTANDVYAVGIGGWEWFPLFPQGFYDALGIVTEVEGRLAKGLGFHFTFGWLFALNGVAYLGYLLLSREWKHLAIDRRMFREAARVAAHDVGLVEEAPVQGKYNAAQRLSYVAVIAMGVLVVLSGIAIYKPEQANALTRLFLGYQNARLVHFTITLAMTGFFVVHILQVARAGWSNFASMVTGHHVEPLEVEGPTLDDVTPATDIPDEQEVDA